MAAISKRLRYEVLRRDGHACYYCGAKAPEVKLVVDAVVPEALGGSHKDPANLRSACDPCNSGKSSSSPDAPLVAAVAEDAARWSQAMATAAAEMLSGGGALNAAHEQFDAAWGRWTYGQHKLPVPKDPGWKHSVDALLAAGLPMQLLEECVQVAMSRKRVSPENTFRYMCGVAWNKVTELQKRAQELVQGDDGGAASDEPDPDEPDIEDEAVQNWCRVILRQRDTADVEIAASDSQGYAGDGSPSSVLWFIIHNLELDRASLADTLRDLMTSLPGDVGSRLIQEHEAQWRERQGPYRPTAPLTTAAQWAAEHMHLEKARREMALLPSAEYESWVQRSMGENTDIAEHLSRAFYVTDAARMIREAASPSSREG